MGARAAMSNAKWALDSAHRPAMASDEFSNQRPQRSIHISLLPPT
jgi:hypothetical protein